MTQVVLVGQEGCSPCKRVKRIIEEARILGASIQLQEIKFSSTEGRKLATEYQILFPPAVFIDGKFFAKGKIGEDELRDVLLENRVVPQDHLH